MEKSSYKIWYEFSVFLRKFGVSANAVKSWNKKGWLPITRIERMSYINKTDIENMMLRFRKSGGKDDVLWLAGGGCFNKDFCALGGSFFWGSGEAVKNSFL